jgi:hypothetical protein
MTAKYITASALVLTFSASLLADPTTSDFIRGDANCDGLISIDDATQVWGWLFEGDPISCDCFDNMDADNNDSITFVDGVYISNYLFKGGPDMDPPFPDCGQEEPGDVIGCESHSSCL